MAARSREQSFFARLPRAADGGANASAGRGDLLVSCALDSLLEFISACAGENQVGMSIDESRQEHAACRVENLGSRLDLALQVVVLAGCNYAAILYQQGCVFN